MRDADIAGQSHPPIKAEEIKKFPAAAMQFYN